MYWWFLFTGHSQYMSTWWLQWFWSSGDHNHGENWHETYVVPISVVAYYDLPFLHHFRFWGWVLHMLCLLGPLWSVYKGFFKIPSFYPGSVFLMVLNPPSGVENSNVKNPPLSYIKSCILTCRLLIWTLVVVFSKQNLA